MTTPTLIVEVAFSAGALTPYLHLDDPTRGLLDTGILAPDVVWTDVTQWVHTVTTKRGASRAEPVIRYDMGQAAVVLDNSDRRFDPTNLSGPYVAAGATQVTPMRAVRIRATWNSTTYDLWRGFADSWQIEYKEPNYSSCTLTASDGFKVLGNHDRVAVAATGTGEDSGARVTRILNSVSWPSADRTVATGDTTLQSTTLDGEALTELFLVADTEIGEFYMDAGGRATFRNRQGIMEDSRSVNSQATFGDAGSELRYQDVIPEYDDTALVNYARIARNGGSEQTAQDTTSQNAYLIHTHLRTDLLMQTDAVAADYAAMIVAQNKDPELRFAAIEIHPLRDPTGLFPQTLGREIGDRITIKRRPPGGGSVIDRDVFIRGIEHRDLKPGTWGRTVFTLQSATRFQFLLLDHSLLGLLDAGNMLAF